MHALRKKPDQKSLIDLAGTIADMSPDTVSRDFLVNAISTACTALCPYPDITEEVPASWARAKGSVTPLWNRGTKPVNPPDIIESTSFTIRGLGSLPEGDTIIGMDKDGKEILYGRIESDHVIAWNSELYDSRLAAANQFFEKYDICTIDEEYWIRGKTEWDCSSGATRWVRELTVDPGADEPDLIRMEMALHFNPHDNKITAAYLDDRDIMPNTNNPEP